MDDDTITIDTDSDTFTIDSATIDLNSIYTSNNMTYGNITTGIGSIGSGGYIFNTNSTANNIWSSTTPYITTTNGTTNSKLTVSGDAEFEGDIKWKGRSLGKMLEKIEDRLAIIQDPDPVKLEKFAALKKAYDNYKLLEKLIGDDYKNESKT
jgi:hypothetical protein